MEIYGLSLHIVIENYASWYLILPENEIFKQVRRYIKIYD